MQRNGFMDADLMTLLSNCVLIDMFSTVSTHFDDERKKR